MWSQIVKYIFWGLILSFILPTSANFILKRSENRSTFNQLILTQELQPYRAKQIECDRKNLMVIDNNAEELADWKLLKILIHNDAHFDEKFIFKTQEDHDQFIFLIKEASRLKRQTDHKIFWLNYCHEESINYSDSLAMLLGLNSKFVKMFDELQAKLKSISKKREDFIINLLSSIDLTTPNNLTDVDKFNAYIFNIDHFFQNINNKEFEIGCLLDLRISLLAKLFAYSVEYYKAWAEFYSQTNKLFLQEYQKRLS